MMKVKVDEGCISCGVCESICDTVFTIEDVAVVNEANIAGNEDSIKEAADSCPVSVIIVEE
jgi:ferredoxin